jgi:ribosomal protein L11 methyltransferase
MNRESEPAAFHAGNLARGLALTSAGRSHFPRGSMKAPKNAENRALWRVAVEIRADAEDAASELIESHFAHPPAIFTDVETGGITATVFVKSPPNRRQLLVVIREAFARMREFGLDPGTGRLSITRVRKQDWAESWKRHFKPFTVGPQLLIRPSWSQRRTRPGQRAVVIDPGLSFGTGQHPTTRFCLEQLAAARIPSARQTFLDVGTGSGILAIAAAKLGYWPVRAFDFDPAAVRVAKENARKNRVNLHLTRGDVTKLARSVLKYDVVCANLTADLLKSCAAKFAGLVKPDGQLVLAGILRTQIFSVRKCFELCGFLTKKSHAEGDWESLLLHRANN